MSESNGRDPKTGRFLTGNAGGGRPKGYRESVSNAFLKDLKTVWEEKGLAALYTMAEQEPGALVRVVATILPKDAQLTIRNENARELSDEQILQLIGDTEAALLQIGFATGVIGAPQNSGELN